MTLKCEVLSPSDSPKGSFPNRRRKEIRRCDSECERLPKKPEIRMDHTSLHNKHDSDNIQHQLSQTIKVAGCGHYQLFAKKLTTSAPAPVLPTSWTREGRRNAFQNDQECSINEETETRRVLWKDLRQCADPLTLDSDRTSIWAGQFAC